ncbi:MAG: hypothetical protein A2365_02140 [Candidatus Nealsonbacteria bacterium RIFOXYB1_FULL_40_15]|uniref:Bifunctional protein FolD n=2 Tax=Candidatus Nealsoniibacteriota TaxID=1817911 RepID=A0A1G2ES75_9BACT|nr:MAG: hypothetical protein A2365_02140 [Candidatus Nealsonbacteria bacterium RIFOXYB1_FULL_40_15]OGZ28656.1 MAG: hypothetical protein A2427_04575 [Candidatus Nealsonbacteria bacterium RIFOXYC1_FULL_40_7]OGZ28874.1 MAG: hypothetical protein A2562_00745 [Candidatus Nealsonbacteria bacterium RIFOXYD1_FULL_39_11]
MIIDGKKISERILNEVRREIQEKELKISLAVILVGDDFSSKIYVKRKEQAAKIIGAGFELFKFNRDISKENLEREIKEISNRFSGLIIQLPLPEGLKDVLKAIPEQKNVESVSPVVSAVEEILKECGISLEGKKIALVGRGKLVGKPLEEWLKEKGLEYFGIEKIKEADIIITGVGKPKLITQDMVKEGAVVIDIGFSHDENGKAVGDVDFNEVSKKASLITPVPGGVGPITVACLFKNLLKLNERTTI